MSNISFSQILIQPEKSKSTCQVVVLDLPTETGGETEITDSRTSYKIFGLIEVENTPNRKIISFINALTQEIKSEQFLYINKTPEAFFEKLIQRINYKYIELIANKSEFFEEEPMPNLNILFALETENNIYLALRGKILPFLIYQIKPQTYKIINIAETATGRDARPNNINLFTNIISGKINPNDYLLFSTESLLDYFSLEKLCKLISTSAPEEAATHLKELLASAANPQTSFAALILKTQPELQPKDTLKISTERQESISLPQHSMAGLLKTASETEKMLTPSLRLNIGGNVLSAAEKIKKLFNKQQAKNQARLEYYPSTFSPPTFITKFLKSIYWIFLFIFRMIYFIINKVALFFVSFLKIIFYLVTNKSGRRKTILQETLKIQQQKFHNINLKFRQMPHFSKGLLVFALIFTILFLSSTIYLYQKYRKNVAIESLNQKIEIIQNKKNLAEASLIYNDEEGARKMISEANELLTQFPTKSKDEKRVYENLKKEIDALQSKLRHVINVDNPIPIINLANQNTNAKVSEFLIVKNNLYVFDDETPLIYKLDLETKEIINKNTSGLNLKFGFLEDNNYTALFYQPKNKFFEFDFKNDIIREKEVILNENETSVVDLAIYNQRLYTLDPTSKQIYRHPATIVGFARGTPWLKENLDIEDASSLAIDGSIYLVKLNGEIFKLNNGYKENFKTNIDPPLLSPTKIWTSTDSSYLYILEPVGKRLLVLDKEGKLKNQYFSEKFDDLKDFIVLENEKKIYLLNGTEIYEIVALHLQ